jgi:hypothetical protein
MLGGGVSQSAAAVAKSLAEGALGTAVAAGNVAGGSGSCALPISALAGLAVAGSAGVAGGVLKDVSKAASSGVLAGGVVFVSGGMGTKCALASNTALHWPQRAQPLAMRSWSGTSRKSVAQAGQRVMGCILAKF